MYQLSQVSCENYMHLKFPKLIVVLSSIVVITGSNVFFTSSKGLIATSPPIHDVSSCGTCHQAITDSFIHTAHYFDSRPADSSSIKGNFEHGKNRYRYNQFMEVVMIREESRFRQSAQVNGMETISAPFDMVIGSGRNGQTYFTWSGNELYQLPVSYYTPAHQWCNSPGFPNYFLFERQVPPNCLECHSTQVKVLSHETNEYDRTSIVYGITCQRCHPGASEHAAYHNAHPEEKVSKYVTNGARLGRQLRMDACALCHSGQRTPLQQPFSFKVGDTLEKYSLGSPVSQKADTLDVHGNQYGLLTSSKCYLKSANMDCSTCHDVHRDQYKKPELFSSKCMTCHTEVDHSTLKLKNKMLLNNTCIDCHMPVLASKKIQLNVKSGEQLFPDYLRSHYISIYKKATADFIRQNR